MRAEYVCGTLRTYRKKACRCEKCRAANARHQRQYQERRKARKVLSEQEWGGSE